MANKRLQAQASRKRKPSGGSGGPSFDFSTLLIGAFVFFFVAAAAWYCWPRPGPSTADRENQQKLKKLATQHPDAEVFDLGSGEKKN